MNLIDLDDPERIVKTDNSPFSDVAALPLEPAVHASIILMENILPKIKHSDSLLRGFNDIVGPIQERAQAELEYDLSLSYPIMCSNCFKYFGDVIGGCVYNLHCACCYNKSPNYDPYRFYRYATHFINRAEVWHGHQTTVLVTRLLYLYYRKDKEKNAPSSR